MTAQDAANKAVSPRVFAALAMSFQLFRKRPGTSCALGAAVGFSVLSACCGLGLLTTPFFICQLLALQLGAYTGRHIARGPAFVRAGGVLLLFMLMVGAVTVISLLAGSNSGSTTPLSPGGVAAALLGSSAAWLLIAPLMYAPLMLLEHAITPELALARSAQITLQTGVFAHARLAFAVFCLQHAPFLLGAWLISLDDAHAAVWALCLAPLLCVSVPLGQGMVVAAYVPLSERAQAAAALPSPFRGWVRVWALLIVLPVLSLMLLEISLSRPSRIAAVSGESAAAGEVLGTFVPTESEQSLELPASALSVSYSAKQVSVVASDGGGVGPLPLAAADPIERVRVVRVRDAFAIELLQGGRTYLTRIDRAGVRLDDDLPARLRDRSQPWQWLYLLWTLLFTVLSSVPVLADLAAASRESSQLSAADAASRVQSPTGAPGHSPAEIQALRRARLLAILLLPWGVGCVAMALYSLFTA